MFSYIILLFVLILIIKFENYGPSGRDAKLYYGLGQNIKSGVGYCDNIRNDEILPSIGYPYLINIALLLGINNGYVWSSIILFLICIVSFIYFRLNNINFIFSLLLLFLLISVIPETNLWGIELSLALFNIVLWCGLIVHIRYYNKWSGILLGVCLFISLLIRPMLMPLLYLLIPVCAFLLIRYSSFRKINLYGIVIITLLIICISSISNIKYKDNRLLSGTYSEIPLYCAFNKYISLTEIYGSDLWNEVPDKIREEALSPLKLPENGWKGRADKINQEVTKFILSQPQKAIEGYLWRLNKYTFSPITDSYFIMFYSWFIVSLIGIIKIFKYKKDYIKLIIIGIPVYCLFVQSIFPFVDQRYYIVPGVFLLFSLTYLLSDYKYFKRTLTR